MDEKSFELASASEEMARDNAIAVSAKAMAPQKHPDFDGVHCLVCDDEIPPQRLAMGRIRCVHCQTRLERGVGR